MLCLQVI